MRAVRSSRRGRGGLSKQVEGGEGRTERVGGGGDRKELRVISFRLFAAGKHPKLKNTR